MGVLFDSLVIEKYFERTVLTLKLILSYLYLSKCTHIMVIFSKWTYFCLGTENDTSFFVLLSLRLIYLVSRSFSLAFTP